MMTLAQQIVEAMPVEQSTSPAFMAMLFIAIAASIVAGILLALYANTRKRLNFAKRCRDEESQYCAELRNERDAAQDDCKILRNERDAAREDCRHLRTELECQRFTERGADHYKQLLLKYYSFNPKVELKPIIDEIKQEDAAKKEAEEKAQTKAGDAGVDEIGVYRMSETKAEYDERMKKGGKSQSVDRDDAVGFQIELDDRF